MKKLLENYIIFMKKMSLNFFLVLMFFLYTTNSFARLRVGSAGAEFLSERPILTFLGGLFCIFMGLVVISFNSKEETIIYSDGEEIKVPNSTYSKWWYVGAAFMFILGITGILGSFGIID